MSYFTQMAGLAFHNFVCAGAGIAVAIAVIRGFVRRSGKTLGNFWVDLTRATLWVLLPISVVFALGLVWQGVPENFIAYTHVKTVEGSEQVIAQGPIASQEIIKEVRIGIVNSGLWATVTTDTSCGAVNSMHDS